MMSSASRLSRISGIALVVLASRVSAAAPPIERDVPYGPDPLQKLDLAVPEGKGFPTILFIHGGSLTSGDKADADYGAVQTPFPGAGIALANVNYRLAPASTWPAQAEDVATAVAWVRANIAARGGNPRKLFLMGHSSGAMLVALVGSDPRYLAKHDLTTATIRGVVPMGSIMWDDEFEQGMKTYGRERAEQAFGRDPDNAMYGGMDAYLDHWPIRHVRAGMPEFLFLIADSEREAPPVLKTDKKFVDDARAKGNRAELEVLSDRTHISAVRRLSEPGDPAFTLVRDFVLRAGR